MELMTFAALAIVLMAVVAGTIGILRGVTGLYWQRFHFSIWSGAFLFLVAFAMQILSGAAGGALWLWILSAVLAAVTVYHDIRLAGFGWGLLAVVLQGVLSCGMLFFAVFALAVSVAGRLFGARSARFSPVFGVGIGMRGEMELMLQFLRIG